MIKKITLTVKEKELPELLRSVRQNIRESFPSAITIGPDWSIKHDIVKNTIYGHPDKGKQYINVYFRDPAQSLIFKLKFGDKVKPEIKSLLPKTYKPMNW